MRRADVSVWTWGHVEGSLIVCGAESGTHHLKAFSFVEVAAVAWKPCSWPPCQRSPDSSKWYHVCTQSNRCEDSEKRCHPGMARSCSQVLFLSLWQKVLGGGPCSPRGSLPCEFTVETGHHVPVNGTGHMVGCGTAVMVKTRGQPPTPLKGTGVISLSVCVSKANACVDTETTAPLRTMRSGEAAGRRRGV